MSSCNLLIGVSRAVRSEELMRVSTPAQTRGVGLRNSRADEPCNEAGFLARKKDTTWAAR